MPLSAEQAVAIAFSEGGGLSELPDVEIFATGEHRGKKWTPADLWEVKRNFDRFSSPAALARSGAKLHVPAVLGHEETQEFLERSDLPAAAWAKALRVKKSPTAEEPDRHVLSAHLVDIPPAVARLLKRRAYRTISAEIYPEISKYGLPGKGKGLRRISALGGDIPQVKTLAEIPDVEPMRERFARPGVIRFRESTGPFRLSEDGMLYTFSEVRPMDTEAMLKALADKGYDTEPLRACPPEALAEMLRVSESAPGPDNYDDEPPDMAQGDSQGMQAMKDRVGKMARYAEKCKAKYKFDDMVSSETPPMKKPDDDQTVKMSEVQRIVADAVKAAVGEISGRVQKFHEEGQTAELVVFLDKHKNKIAPGRRDEVLARLQRAAKIEGPVKFGENGKTVTLTELEAQKREIAAWPIKFGEGAPKGPKSAPAPGRKAPSDPSDDEVGKVQEAYECFREKFPRAVTSESLVKGFNIERKINPELTAADFLEGLVA